MLGRYIDLGDPVSDHPLNQGLVSWWLPLPNNSGGSQLFDLCARNHGTLTNGPTWAAGPLLHQAVSFDGSNDRVTVSHNASLSVSSKVSLSCWVCPAVFPPVASGSYAGLVAKSYDGSKVPYYLDISSASDAGDSSPTLRFGYYDGAVDHNVKWVISGWSAGEWRHVGGVFDGSTYRLYVGGVQVGSSTDSTVPSTNTLTLDIGTTNLNGSYARFLNGKITDVRLSGSAVNMPALYEQSRRCHPDTLRRWSRSAWFLGAGGGSATSAGMVIPRRRFRANTLLRM